MGETKRVVSTDILLLAVLMQRSWQHCQQLDDLLRIAGGVGRDAATEAVDERAKAMMELAPGIAFCRKDPE